MRARLQHVETNRIVPIDKPILFVGRHPECDLIINDSRKVSRKHCCLAEVEGQVLVRDLGSTNGIQVNGQRVTKTLKLSSGDELIVGDVLYRYLDANTKDPAPPPPEPKKQLSDDGIPYQDPSDSKSDSRDFGDHELSSDMPIMLPDPESDGFDIVDNSPTRRKNSDSDSRPELIAD